MSNIFHRNLASAPPVAVAGEGPYLIDGKGRRYIDASGGAAVSCLGHSHPAVIEAIKAQLDRMPYAHTGFFSSEPAERLATFLAERAPAGLRHIFFTSGGSEATETAMKLVRQYMVESGQPQRTRFIAREQSYHGNTLGALALGGHKPRRALYAPLLIETSHIPPCFAYRHQRDDETDEAYGLRAADALETEILRLGPASVAAFVAETVVGATAGCVTAAPGYFQRIREICDRYGVLLVLDEVMSGMGRTGSLYACAQEEVVPDLLTCAKGLGAGYQPIGAVVVSDKVHDVIAKGSGAFQHGFTYIGHATACAAALAVQETIERDDLLANVRRQGDALWSALEARFGNHHNVGDIRGRGLFIALELVVDHASKEPFDPAQKLALRVKREAFERGLLCYPSSGTIDGTRGDHVLLAPPYIVNEEHIGIIVQTLGEAVDAAIAGAKAA